MKKSLKLFGATTHRDYTIMRFNRRFSMPEEYSFSWNEGDGGELHIAAVPSPFFPDTCFFTVDRPIYPDSAVHFAGKESSTGSPLAEALFELEDIDQILVVDSTIRVTIKSPQDWEKYAPKVAGAIRDQIATGKPAVDEKIKENLPPPEKIRERVKEILDRDINPSIASHGGFVKLLDVRGNNLFLELGGGCHGCAMANITLKYGIERHLRANVPELGEILDTTDHASGKNPYYSNPAE